MPDPGEPSDRGCLASVARLVSIGRYHCDSVCAYRLPPSWSRRTSSAQLVHISSDGIHLAGTLQCGTCVLWQLSSENCIATLPIPATVLKTSMDDWSLLPCLLGAHDVDGNLLAPAHHPVSASLSQAVVRCDLLLVDSLCGQWHCVLLEDRSELHHVSGRACNNFARDEYRRDAHSRAFDSQSLGGFSCQIEQSGPSQQHESDAISFSPAPLSQISNSSPSQFVQRFAY